MNRKYVKTKAAVMLAVFFWMLTGCSQGKGSPDSERSGERVAPVEVAEVHRGPVVLRRAFSGTLEAASKFVVSPKVAGRVESIRVDLADNVKRGQVVAELDNEEYVQAVAQARADLEVARANLSEAGNALNISSRDLQRIETLRKRGVASESQYDAAKAEWMARQAQLEVAEAHLTRAESALETANIRLGYTKIKADWTSGGEQRVVAERYIDQGETVSANEPLLLIVELHPITGVIHVTEKDYARMRTGQTAALTTDAFPGEVFEGRITRISPVFRQDTRQARVELSIENPLQRLKPGMFIRAEVVLERISDAVTVPHKALTTRNGRTGVFVVSGDGQTVAWRPVEAGISEGDRVQVEGTGLAGRVVTLGQQLVDDGSRITIPDDGESSPSPGK